MAGVSLIDRRGGRCYNALVKELMNMAEIIDPRYILERITAAQREAAALLLHARGVLAENKTGHRDVVTEYDRQVQTLLMRRLEEALPGASFFCEENERAGRAGRRASFYIDPERRAP